MDKKWREVSSVFNFSPTTTSASYVLRKHYHNILRKYERAYFLKGPPLNATGMILNGFSLLFMGFLFY